MEELLNQLNPWWNKENNHKGIIRKKYFKKVLSLLKEDEIIFITGIRRVGKTTLIKQVIHHLITEKKIESNKILFLNLDHIEFLNLSIHDIIKEYRKINQIKYDDFFIFF